MLVLSVILLLLSILGVRIPIFGDLLVSEVIDLIYMLMLLLLPLLLLLMLNGLPASTLS